ncbi:MAG: glycosyltransferase family 1 protein [Candidatus Pacebacteria bacterium]|nr:glycosyltransferase family 1 protein [Candidatus Paceibacterota bacterium]
MIIGIDIRNIGKKRTGDEAVFFNLVKNLAAIDDKNEYHLFTDIANTPILHNIGVELGLTEKDNFKIITLPTANKFSWNFWTLPKYLRKNPVDIYLTQYITPWFVPKKIKIVTIIHDVSFKVYKQFIKKSDLFFLNCLIPRSIKRADKVVGVSKFTRNEIIKYYKTDPAKVDFIYNAVADDFSAEDTSEEKIKSVKEKYHLPEKYILYIGTLQPRKNISTLVEAFALLKMGGKFDSLKLVIAGGKGHNYDKKIDTAVANNKLEQDVIFPGFVAEEDKAALMAAADIFCFPSFYEGFGIPILEAMSVGTPVAASDIAPHREIADEAALFFNPDVAGEITQKLTEILKNNTLHNNLTIKGHAQVPKFSWRQTAEKMLNIFESLK